MIWIYILCAVQVMLYNAWQLFPEPEQWQVQQICLRIIPLVCIAFVAFRPCRFGVSIILIHCAFMLKDVLDVSMFQDVENPMPELTLYCLTMAVPAFMKHFQK